MTYIRLQRSLDPVRAAGVGCLEEHAAHAAHCQLLAAGPALAHVARRGGVQAALRRSLPQQPAHGESSFKWQCSGDNECVDKHPNNRFV